MLGSNWRQVWPVCRAPASTSSTSMPQTTPHLWRRHSGLSTPSTKVGQLLSFPKMISFPFPIEGKFKDLALSNFASWEVVRLRGSCFQQFLINFVPLYRLRRTTSARQTAGSCQHCTKECTMQSLGTTQKDDTERLHSTWCSNCTILGLLKRPVGT